MTEEKDRKKLRADAERTMMVPEIQRRRAERKRAVQGYKSLVTELSALLYRLDPVGINFGDNRGEYDPEAEDMVPLLVRTASQVATLEIVYDEFVRQFDQSAGPKSAYEPVAREVWLLVCAHRAR